MTAAALGLVVIGSGRSGTAWAARQLTDAGVPCGHESVFDWHPSPDPTRRLDYPGRTPSPHEPPPEVELAAESSLAAIHYLDQLPPGCAVLHLARDPLAVVASWAPGMTDPRTPYGAWVRRQVAAIEREPHPLGKAARWVAEWNLIGRDRALAAGLPYRLERLEDIAPPSQVVNRHRSKPAPPWESIAAAATPETVGLLRQWATLAGYPLAT